MTHKLLLADDSVTIQRVIELTFADEDVDVTTVGDGQLAIDRLDTERFDIVLADVDMPKRDGYEVATYVKSRPKLAHIPVVLLTGAFEPVDQARADAAGSSDVLAKPFEPQMVINRVKELLSKKKAEDAPGRVGGPAPVAAQAAPTLPHAGPPRAPGHAAAEPLAQAAAPGGPVSLDDYFDQLDAAFSSLQPSSPAPAPAPNRESAQNGDMDWSSFMEPLSQQPPVAKAPQPQFAQQAQPQTLAPQPQPVKAVPAVPPYARPAAPSAWPTPPIVPVPVSVPPAHPAAVAPAPAAPSPARSAATIAPWAPAPAAPPMPQHEPTPVPPAAPAAAAVHTAPPPAPEPAAHPPTNPFSLLSAAKAEVAAAAAARPPAPVITEEVIEEVVARVLQRLSDRVVRETVTEIVSKTAEQAVREEIERIKSGGE